jgi:TonB family protein
MQASLILAVVSLLALSSHDGKESDCGEFDPDPIYCPKVQAPRITELAPGSAVVAFTVQPDGSVSSARVINSDNAQWNTAAVEAVSHWRYKSAHRATQKSQRFQFSSQP